MNVCHAVFGHRCQHQISNLLAYSCPSYMQAATECTASRCEKAESRAYFMHTVLHSRMLNGLAFRASACQGQVVGSNPDLADLLVCNKPFSASSGSEAHLLMSANRMG